MNLQLLLVIYCSSLLLFVNSDDLFFSVTYRDFLPASCSLFRTNGLQDFKAAWGQPGNTNSPSNSCTKYQGTGLQTAISAGTIDGHPDFDASTNFYVDQGQCLLGGVDNSNFPSETCMFLDGRGDPPPGVESDLTVIQRELRTGDNGLPKPIYCSDLGDEANVQESRCGFVFRNAEGNLLSQTLRNRQTQTQKKFFDAWYNDDLKYNRRIGQRLRLTNTGSGDANKFIFDSNIHTAEPDFEDDQDAIDNFFGPLNRFKRNNGIDAAINAAVNDLNNILAWPQTYNVNSNGDQFNRGFSYTTELHTTFKFLEDENMEFDFSGDDDFWAFVNNKMVIDLGGLHSSQGGSINLNGITSNGTPVKDILGLVDGQVYTLDIFHAERQNSGSNFKMTTTLLAPCNAFVVGEATVVVDSSDRLSNAEFEALFAAQNVDYEANTGNIVLQKDTERSAGSSVFLRNQINALRGFVASFTVKVNQATDGFAFVVQSFGIVDYPLTFGPNFSLKGVTNSLAIVFDLCASREDNTDDSICAEQEVRVHYPDSPDLPNSALKNGGTLKTHDRVFRSMKRNVDVNIEIVYYGGEPDFLEVYIDGSLYLRESKFFITKVIGAAGAHVGFTASSSPQYGADIIVSDFVVRTVEVDPEVTQLENANAGVQILAADGESDSEGFGIVTFDGCESRLEAGTLEELVFGKFFILPAAEEPGLRSKRLQDPLDTITATVVDNFNGTYNLKLITDVVGEYSLAVAFGENCDFEVVLNDQNEPEQRLLDNSARCFLSFQNDGEPVVNAVPPELAPTQSPTDPFVAPDDNRLILPIAGSAGGLVLVALIAALVLIRYRRKWNRDKNYVADGNLYRRELDTTYAGGDAHTEIGKKVLESRQELLALQALAKNDPRSDEIKTLKRENDEMRTMVRMSKARAEHNNADGQVAQTSKRKKRDNRMEL